MDSFLPASTGASMVVSGVSMRSVVSGRSRVISYPISSAISRSNARNAEVERFRSRISVSLC
jgi:hypothetical protein